MDGWSNIAAVRGQSGIELRHSRVAAPSGDGVVFSVECAAVCGTDRQIVRGVRPDQAQILGHEGVVRVLAVGPRVRNLSVGGRYV